MLISDDIQNRVFGHELRLGVLQWSAPCRYLEPSGGQQTHRRRFHILPPGGLCVKYGAKTFCRSDRLCCLKGKHQGKRGQRRLSFRWSFFFFFFNRKFRDVPTCFDCFENPMKPTESRGATSPSMDRHGNKTMSNQPFKLFSAKLKPTDTTWLVSCWVFRSTFSLSGEKKASWQPEPRRSEVVI